MPKQIISPNPITGFTGLNERRLLTRPSTETSTLLNVRVRNGVVEGRRGSRLYGDVATDAGTPIIGMWEFYRSTLNTGTLIRMLPTALEYWTGSAWSDITGTALNGTTATRPQGCTVGEIDTFVALTEGLDRPQKYTGTGDFAVLGGTPPYAKCLEFYVGFLALGNISEDGSTFRPLDVILSDDPDGTWEECDDTEIYVTTLTIDESPGEVRALRVLGSDLLVYKSDAIVAVRFTGGPTRFSRRKLDFPMGIIAPLSLQSIGGNRHIFLAQDRNLYLTDGQRVEQVPPNLQRSLQETLLIDNAPFVRSSVDEEGEVYNLFF